MKLTGGWGWGVRRWEGKAPEYQLERIFNDHITDEETGLENIQSQKEYRGTVSGIM